MRVDYVCDRRFRVQNPTGAPLMLSHVLKGAAGDTLEEAGVGVPSQGPWTPFTVARPEGSLHVSHDGRPIATVAATA